MKCFFIAVLFTVFSSASQAETILRMAPSTDLYVVELVQFIIKHTEEFPADTKVQVLYTHSTDERSLHLLEQNSQIDILWGIEREHSHENVQFYNLPILKDLQKYRALLIRKGEQEQFRDIANLEKLREFKSGMGPNWPEFSIFSSHKLPIVSNPVYNSLFPMLSSGRFDYMPRWPTQAFAELNLEGMDGIEVSQHTALYLGGEFGFYINKDNLSMAESLIRGFSTITENGKFDSFFSQHPYSADANTLIHNNSINIIDLSDSLLKQAHPNLTFNENP
jgi:hypothetical protein